MNKTILRKKIRILKTQYSTDTLIKKSNSVINKIELNEIFIHAKTIMVYWSLEDEVYTHDFIEKWRHNKNILLPVIDGDRLKLKVFLGKDKMKPDDIYGILEPQGSYFTDYKNIDIVLVPGMAFDASKNRMGRGKGFYDKFLPALSCPKIGICFDFQIIENLSVDSFDIPMDVVISENHEFI